MVCGELLDQRFDLGFPVQMMPGPRAQVIKVEGFLRKSGRFGGEDLAQRVGLQWRREPKPIAPGHHTNEMVVNGNRRKK